MLFTAELAAAIPEPCDERIELLPEDAACAFAEDAALNKEAADEAPDPILDS